MFVPNFKILGQVTPEKSLTKNIGVRDRKTENRKRRQKYILTSWFCLQLYTWLSSLCILNLKTVALIDTELIRSKKLLERKKNGQIK